MGFLDPGLVSSSLDLVETLQYFWSGNLRQTLGNQVVAGEPVGYLFNLPGLGLVENILREYDLHGGHFLKTMAELYSIIIQPHPQNT